MNKAFSLGLSAVLAIAFQVAQAEASTEITVDNGSICDTVGGGQKGMMQWRATGLFNQSSTDGVWVVCPVHSVREENGDPTTNTVLVDIANYSGFLRLGSCYYREVTPGGNIVKAAGMSFNLPGGGTDSVSIVSSLSDYRNSATVACLMPPLTQITRVITVTTH